jgi:hypothetical protein
LERVLTELVKQKVLESIERTEHLVSLVPSAHLAWSPQFSAGTAPALDLAHILGHLLDCLAGFCAVFATACPAQTADLQPLRTVSVNQACSPAEAAKGIRLFASHIERGFQCCSDADLARKIPTVFVPQGETLLTLLLGNLEHLTNHKYQLFLYLKLAGLAVGTRDIYQFRGSRESGHQ